MGPDAHRPGKVRAYCCRSTVPVYNNVRVFTTVGLWGGGGCVNIKGLISQFLKFGVVGVIATAIDFGVMVALTELLGVPPVVSAAVSYCVSTVFNYLASMRYVFRHREELSRTREFLIFVVLSVIGLGFNELIMWLGSVTIGDQWYVATKVVATALVMFWNFFSRKRWLDAGSRA